MAIELKHPVVRTDLMHGTDVRGELVSFKYMPGNTETAIENGNVVLLDKLISGEREVFAAGNPAANSKLKDIVLVASPEVMYDERMRNLDEFTNEAGTICRGFHLHQHDAFSVTENALQHTAEIAVGHAVELQAGTKMKVVASATASATQIGHIEAIEIAGRYTYYVIRVD